MASSTATSPPPTTTASLPLKKKASHVAQADTPLPFSLASDSRPSHIAEDPVAIMTASATYPVFAPTTVTLRGFVEKSTELTALSSNFEPNLSACFRIFSIRSGPFMASGKPGKFSTSVVNIS